MTINEVAPPGFGHTKGDKEKGVKRRRQHVTSLQKSYVITKNAGTKLFVF